MSHALTLSCILGGNLTTKKNVQKHVPIWIDCAFAQSDAVQMLGPGVNRLQLALRKFYFNVDKEVF